MNHHKKRDEETEFLMPGLMMKKMHAKESPQRSSKGSPCEECDFPDAPGAMDGFPLVDAVENACDGIEDEEEGKYSHTGHDDALRGISLRKQPDEREVLQEGSFGILPR